MLCPFCGKETPKQAEFCQFCRALLVPIDYSIFKTEGDKREASPKEPEFPISGPEPREPAGRQDSARWNGKSSFIAYPADKLESQPLPRSKTSPGKALLLGIAAGLLVLGVGLIERDDAEIFAMLSGPVAAAVTAAFAGAGKNRIMLLAGIMVPIYWVVSYLQGFIALMTYTDFSNIYLFLIGGCLFVVLIGGGLGLMFGGRRIPY